MGGRRSWDGRVEVVVQPMGQGSPSEAQRRRTEVLQASMDEDVLGLILNGERRRPCSTYLPRRSR